MAGGEDGGGERDGDVGVDVADARALNEEPGRVRALAAQHRKFLQALRI